MKIIVQKFGGTSVQTAEVRKKAAQHVFKAVEDGYKVIVVVSAMGRKPDPYATDTLLGLVDRYHISKREQDLLISCGEIISAVVFSELLGEMGIKASALTGAKAGFLTNSDFTNAKITEMRCDHLKKLLEVQDVLVVAGFQGQTEEGDITTLGRGGSDTSATALGVALEAEWVDIFTDVEGIMTADPRIVAEAKPLDTLTYAEVSNLANQGAKVIHPRAIEIAMKANIPVHIRQANSDKKGTLVTSASTNKKVRDVEERLITGIAHLANVTQIKVFANDGQYDLQEKVFKAMANEEISVDFININPRGVVYTVMDEVADKAIERLEEMGYSPEVHRHCAKVSAVGAGMAGVPGVTAQIVGALAKSNVQILQSADSHTTIWVLVNGKDMNKAVNALHNMFHLEEVGQHQRNNNKPS